MSRSSIRQLVLVPVTGVLSITARHAGIVVVVDFEPFEKIPEEIISEMYMDFPTLKKVELTGLTGPYKFTFESDDVADASKMYREVAIYLQRKVEDSILDRF